MKMIACFAPIPMIIMIIPFAAAKNNYFHGIGDSPFQTCIKNSTLERVDIYNKTDDCRRLSVYSFMLEIYVRGANAIKSDWYRLTKNDLKMADIEGVSFFGIENEDALRDLVNVLPQDIKVVNTGAITIPRLDEGIFNHSGLLALDINGVYVNEIADNAVVMPNLERFSLWNSPISDLKFVASLPSLLKTLVLASNKIAKIPAKTFSNLRHLKILGLRRNRITTVESGAFYDLHQLESLDLSFNGLSEFGKDVFVGLKSLVELNLQENPIAVVDAGTFDLPNLRTLKFGIHGYPYDQTVVLKRGAMVSMGNECNVQLYFGKTVPCTDNRRHDVECHLFDCWEYKGVKFVYP